MAEAAPSTAELSQIKDLVRQVYEKGLAAKHPPEQIDADIQEFLSAKGVTPEQLQAFDPSIAEDIGNLAPGALRTGVEAIPGGPGETAALAPQAIRWILEKSGASKETLAEFDAAQQKGEGGIPYLTPAVQAITSHLPDMSTVRKGTDWLSEQTGIDLPGSDYQPQTGTGEVAQTVIENAPSTVLNPGSWISKGVDLIGSSGGEELAAYLIQNLPDSLKPYVPEIVARMAGAAAGSRAGSGFNAASNPRPTDPHRQPHLDVLEQEGVDVSAGQRTGDERLRKAEQMAGGVESIERQSEQFTQAAARRQGGFPEGTSRLDRATMNAELTRMEGEFDRLGQASSAPMNQQLVDDMVDVVDQYRENNPHVAPVVANMVDELFDNATNNGGVLGGTPYQNQRTRINELIRNEGTDPGVRAALIDLQDVIDNHIAAGLSPEDQAAWRTVRAQYRNFQPLQHAMAAPGANTASGTLNPKQLQAGIKAEQGARSRATGRNDFQDLADAGEVGMTNPPSSGTPEGLRALLSKIAAPGAGALAGGVTAVAGGSPAASVAAAGATTTAAALLPALRDAFIRSRTGQAFLGRQGPRIDTGGPTNVAGARPLGGTAEISPEMARYMLAMLRVESMRDRADARGR